MARTGRPTDFREEFGEQILERMESGLSLAAAAADIGVHRERVYAWVQKHEEFANTIKIAKAKRQLFLERRLLAAEASPVVVSSIFALKNAARADWRDKQDIEHTGKDGTELVPKLDTRQLARAIVEVLSGGIAEKP